MYPGTKEEKKSGCRHVAFRKPMAYKLILLEAVAIMRFDTAIWLFTWPSPQSPFPCHAFCCNLLRTCFRSWYVLKPKYCDPLTLKENEAPGLCGDIPSLSELAVPYVEAHLLLPSCHCFSWRLSLRRARMLPVRNEHSCSPRSSECF